MTEWTPQKIADNNIWRFIAFRVFFNARYYYPIFAIIFLDFGLTLDQFAILNAIWAATIILAEVPSGAFSDLLGRKKLLIMTASLMVLEMVVWILTPPDSGMLLFWLMAINRILSGLGEASASGSDEAIAYDSLEQAGRKKEWSHVLARVGRWQSFAFMMALLIGGVVYDPNLLNNAAGLLGIESNITKESVLKLPILLTLINGIITLVIVLGLKEPLKESAHEEGDLETPSIGEAFKQTWKAAKWIAHTPFALTIIVGAAFVDSVIRMLVTMTSEYYRLINFEPYMLGFIGLFSAGLGMITAPISRRMFDNLSPSTNFLIISALAIIGFYGVSLFIPYFGLIFAALLFAAFTMLTFGVSFYLNNATDKKLRATVLSFKGMALNLGYGFIGVLYAQLLSYLRNRGETELDKDTLFMEASEWFTWYYVIGAVLVIIFSYFRCPKLNQTAKELQNHD